MGLLPGLLMLWACGAFMGRICLFDRLHRMTKVVDSSGGRWVKRIDLGYH